LVTSPFSIRIGAGALSLGVAQEQSRTMGMSLRNDMENAVDFVFGEIVNGSILGLDKYPFSRVNRDD
jgi:hypothetical protein